MLNEEVLDLIETFVVGVDPVDAVLTEDATAFDANEFDDGNDITAALLYLDTLMPKETPAEPADPDESF